MLVASAGIFGTVIGMRAALRDFSPAALGLVASAYYGGFVIGSRTTVRVLGSVGHIRAYSALAATMAAAVLTAGYLDTAAVWIGLRFVVGLCLAGLYVVAESWLNHLVGNDRRGRLLTSYLLVTTAGFALGQWLSGKMPSVGAGAFAAAAVLTCLAIVPVSLSEAARPPFSPPTDSIGLRELYSVAPTGMVTTSLVGLAQGAFLGLAAIYATRAGLPVTLVGGFVAMPTLGGVVSAVPTAWASDRFDRRLVALVEALVAVGAGVVLLNHGTSPTGWIAMAVIGAGSMPLYSVAGAYANDRVPTSWLNAAASQLVMLFGIGAGVGPLLGAAAMGRFGSDGFAFTIIGTHAAIACFVAIRIVQYPSSVRARPDRMVRLDTGVPFVPATAAAMGRRLRLRRPSVRGESKKPPKAPSD